MDVLEREGARIELQAAIFRALDAGCDEDDIADMVQQSIADYRPEEDR